jgi:hypothetical protein
MLAKVLVTCPKCGYRAMLDHGNQRTIDVEIEGHCENGTSPLGCPILVPAIARARKAMEEIGG